MASWFDLALKHGYETPDVHYYKSMILVLANQDSRALDCLNKVLGMAPYHTYALYDKGRILMGNLQHDDALACFNKIRSKTDDVYLMMGKIYLDKSMDDKAVKYLNKVASGQDTTQAAQTKQGLLKRIQRRQQYRTVATAYNDGLSNELDHLRPEQWFPKPMRQALIAWVDQAKSTKSGAGANLVRLYDKIKGRADPWKGGSGFFLQAALTQNLWNHTTGFPVTNVEHNYEINQTRKIDIDIELDGRFCVQVWSAISTEGLITTGEFDDDSRLKNLQRGLTTKFGGLGGDADRDWIGLEAKLSQLPDDKPGFVVVGYPIWPPIYRYRIKPEYCHGMPDNKCVIVLDIDLHASSLSGSSILYYHQKCNYVDTARAISKDMGFEPCLANPFFPFM